MSRHISAVLNGFVHLKAIVLHRIKVLDVLEQNAFPVDPRLRQDHGQARRYPETEVPLEEMAASDRCWRSDSSNPVLDSD